MPRKKKPNRDKGKPVRLSNEVLNELRSRLRRGESFDSLMRRFFGLPDRLGNPQPIRTYWLLPSALVAAPSLAEARGEAILRAVQQGKRKTERPIKVIERI